MLLVSGWLPVLPKIKSLINFGESAEPIESYCDTRRAPHRRGDGVHRLASSLLLTYVV